MLKALTLPRIAAVFAIAGIAVAAAVLINSPLVDVEDVRVEGAEALNPTAVAQLAGLRGRNMFSLDLDAAERRVERLSMVKSASASRNWPNSVKLVIVERRPSGRWRAGDTVWSIDDEGVVLEGGAPGAGGTLVKQVSDLPVVRPGHRVDTSAIELAELIGRRGAPELASGEPPDILGYEWDLATGLTVVTRHGRIVFGSADSFDFKYEAWAGLEREAARRGEPLLLADLRYGARPRVEIGHNVGRGPRWRSAAQAGQWSTDAN